MKKLLMAWVLAIVICLQSGVSMAATEDMAKIDSIEVKELGLNLIKVEMPLEKGFESIYGQDYAPLTILVYNDKSDMKAIDERLSAFAQCQAIEIKKFDDLIV